MEEATDGYVAYVLEQVEAAKQTCSLIRLFWSSSAWTSPAG
jgi:hypothetical protein